MYEAARSYLELPQRIDLLNARVEVSCEYSRSNYDMLEREIMNLPYHASPFCSSVIAFNSMLLITRLQVLQDMLKLLKESVTSRHGERLEQIVIVLIGIEIRTYLHLLFHCLSLLPYGGWCIPHSCPIFSILDPFAHTQMDHSIFWLFDGWPRTSRPRPSYSLLFLCALGSCL